MKNIKSLLVDNVGLPYLIKFYYGIMAEVFHTDNPHGLTMIYYSENNHGGYISKNDWFNEKNFTDGFAGRVEESKAKHRFNRFKLSFKTFEIDHWMDKKSSGYIEYSFLLSTDRVVCTFDEIEGHVRQMKMKTVEKYNITPELNDTKDDVDSNA